MDRGTGTLVETAHPVVVGENGEGAAAVSAWLLLESLDGIVWCADPATLALSYVSPQAAKLLGHPLEAWMGGPDWLGRLFGEGGRSLRGTLAAVREDGVPRATELPVRTVDGRQLWMSVRLQAQRGRAGAIEALVGLMVDVTERRVAEEQRWKRLVSEGERLALRVAVQKAAARALAQAATVERAATGALRALCNLLDWRVGLFWQVEEPRSGLGCHVSYAAPGFERTALVRESERTRIPLGVEMAGRVSLAGEPEWASSLSVEGILAPARASAAAAAGLDRAMALPVRGEGETMCVIELLGSGPVAFPEEQLSIASAVAVQLSHFVRRVRTHEEIAAREAAARRRAEEELRRSRDEMLAILQGLSEGIAVLDADGTLVFANDVAARLSGFADLGEMRAAGVHSVLSRFHVLDEEGQPIAVEDPAERRARAGQPVERVVRVRRTSPIVPAANGRAATDEDRWILVRATAMAAASGAVGRVIKLYRDITDRKRAESWQRFLGEATSILAGALDEPTKLESVGKLAAGSVADCCALDVADRDGWMTAPVFSGCGDTGLLTRFRERWGDLPVAERLGVAEALRTGRSQRLADGPGAPGADRRRADELRALGLKSLLVVPLATRGQTLGVLALGSATRRYGAADLREAEELARRIAVFVDNGRLYADAQEAVRSREDLLAVVSHDLRNPLGVVLASSALLLHHGADLFENERARRQLEAIQRAANRMNRLIRDLLDFASIQGGRLAISRRVQGAAALIGEALDALEPLASAKQIRLVRGLPETELAVSCDRDRMIQVFSNLVGNAIKFTPEGGTITVEAVPAGDRVRFSVADTGPGIREHELGHVFDRYWQARRRNRDGIGLGLSIAKGIVEAHGGDIWVESPAGAGATFFFTVPVHAP